jgi:hypothetical protein
VFLDLGEIPDLTQHNTQHLIAAALLAVKFCEEHDYSPRRIKTHRIRTGGTVPSKSTTQQKNREHYYTVTQ